MVCLYLPVFVCQFVNLIKYPYSVPGMELENGLFLSYIYRLIYQYWYCATSTVGILDLVVSRSIFVNLAVAPGLE